MKIENTRCEADKAADLMAKELPPALARLFREQILRITLEASDWEK